MKRTDSLCTRTCRKCGDTKDIGLFTRNNQGTPTHECKVCAYARTQVWSAANPERSRAIKQRYADAHPVEIYIAKRKYYDNHKENAISKAAAYKSANREKVNSRYREQYACDPARWRARQLAYEMRHPERVKALSKAARARRRKQVKASASHYTGADVLNLLAQQKNQCAEPSCRILLNGRYHVDHIMPLARGGSNAKENIQLLCPSCNLKKNQHDPYVWAQRHGRLF